MLSRDPALVGTRLSVMGSWQAAEPLKLSFPWVSSVLVARNVLCTIHSTQPLICSTKPPASLCSSSLLFPLASQKKCLSQAHHGTTLTSARRTMQMEPAVESAAPPPMAPLTLLSECKSAGNSTDPAPCLPVLATGHCGNNQHTQAYT